MVIRSQSGLRHNFSPRKTLDDSWATILRALFLRTISCQPESGRLVGDFDFSRDKHDTTNHDYLSNLFQG
ncbi:hypothetical protein I7I53_01985 [Histoplasma capsulatum var. duboisii H88]|uniref:Uncharacterized protein n=2 Tax=Ajellomyces capsulatus TaxID=5037 RepID=A0A8H7YL33_AJECA|nr:hypothetical protein I7I52_04767 [Histoplasma capsulatum]QSS54441.1 hypothetical protein I7I53_01985 [Histoplasma capsulatum var. duboisii H88]QSS74902.1 hypothetical protein I7I50_03859 [Histoplasma capsulatum G186AR]